MTLYPNTLIAKQTADDDDGNDVEGDYVQVDLAEGLVVTTWLSTKDGALVVQIDTPEEGPHAEQHNRCRIYVNDYQCPNGGPE